MTDPPDAFPRLTGSIAFKDGIPIRLHHEGRGYTVQPIFTSASKKIVDTEFKEGVPIHLTYGGVTYDVLPPSSYVMDPSSYVMEEDDPAQQHPESLEAP
ncbi:MAG: hypothetical protein IIB22_02465 [Chloroflexi bacterium]|nr:hypothetical protein [Chloroflexota bacterium]